MKLTQGQRITTEAPSGDPILFVVDHALSHLSIEVQCFTANHQRADISNLSEWQQFATFHGKCDGCHNYAVAHGDNSMVHGCSWSDYHDFLFAMNAVYQLVAWHYAEHGYGEDWNIP